MAAGSGEDVKKSEGEEQTQSQTTPSVAAEAESAKGSDETAAKDSTATTETGGVGKSNEGEFIALNEKKGGDDQKSASTEKPEQSSEAPQPKIVKASPDAADGEHVKKFFDNNSSVEFVRLHWLDYSATLRARLITPRQAIRLASNAKTVSTASPMLTACLIDGSFHEVHNGNKDQLVPDWSTLRLLHYEPTHASVICSIEDATQGLLADPRHLLKSSVAEIEKNHGQTFLVGVEVEFYLTRSATSTKPVEDDARQYCSTASLRTPYATILTSAARAIEDAGIPVWAAHTETVGGQFEISTDPLGPLEAADSLIYIYEAIKTTAWKHGYHATLHPKPFDKIYGVGLHMHLSLQKQTDKDDSFLQGVLSSIPAISAISMPNYDSWLRRDFAGGDYIGWDVENRMSSIRKIDRAYWEMRFIDCMANPHLTLAAILGTGIKAWEKGTPLTVKANSQQGENDSGDKVRAPRDLSDALTALKKDEALKEVIGEKALERYIAYKEHEEKFLGELTLQERRELAMKLF